MAKKKKKRKKKKATTIVIEEPEELPPVEMEMDLLADDDIKGKGLVEDSY